MTLARVDATDLVMSTIKNLSQISPFFTEQGALSMTDALADLFSATSPTRAPRRTPSLPASPESTSVEALFLSPGQTPDRAARRPKPTRPRAPSPRIAARRSKSPSLPPLILDDPVAVLAPEFDPLVAPIGGSGGDDDLPVKKRRVMAKIDEERSAISRKQPEEIGLLTLKTSQVDLGERLSSIDEGGKEVQTTRKGQGGELLI